jgi:hypothetical protein
MKKVLFLFLSACLTLFVKAQSINDWQVTKIMSDIPVQQTFSTSGIAGYTNQKFTEPFIVGLPPILDMIRIAQT